MVRLLTRQVLMVSHSQCLSLSEEEAVLLHLLTSPEVYAILSLSVLSL